MKVYDRPKPGALPEATYRLSEASYSKHDPRNQ